MTAVEFLFNELGQLIPSECQEVYVKALEMEKQQIIDAYAGGVLNECSGANIRSNQYYEYNYGNKG